MKTRTQGYILYCFFVITILLTLACPTESMAASVLAFSNNQGSFSIQANNLVRMTSAEVRISYEVNDQSEKAQVTLYPNTNYILTQSSGPGYLDFKLAYIEKVYPKGNKEGIANPMQRLSGDYKLLAIARIPGDITALSASICSDKAGCESLQGSVTNPVNNKSDDKNAQNDKTNKTDKADTATTPDIITSKSPMQPDAGNQKVAPPSVERLTNPSSGETEVKSPIGKVSKSSADKSKEAEDIMRPISFLRRESLFDRFISSIGEKTTALLTQLLQSSESSVVQDPPLLLSDGTAALRLTVRSLGQSKQASQFFISGGHCTDLKNGGNGIWILEIVPEQGVLNTSVTILADKEAIEYPLAVAPLLELFDAIAAESGQAEFVRAANEVVRDITLR